MPVGWFEACFQKRQGAGALQDASRYSQSTKIRGSVLDCGSPLPLFIARMNISYRLGWIGFRALYRFYFRRRVFNAERVPLTGPVILASNHASFLDPPLVGSGLRRPINYLARESLFRFPGIGALLRSWNSVPVDRDGGGAAGLKAILERLLAGGGDHFISRRHADARRPVAARALRHRFGGDQVRRAGRAGADVWNVRGLRAARQISPAQTGGGEIWPADAI